MKSQTFRVNTLKFVAALGTSLVCLTLGLCMLFALARPLSAAVFIGIGALFLPICATYGASLRIDDEGVTRLNLFGRKTRFLPWREIAEIGVAGSRVLGRGDKKKNPGTLYIYFSENEMTEQQRFETMLHFPTKGLLFTTYSQAKIEAVQLRWSSRIATYNSGTVTFS